MKKLNNKGFAVASILYSIMVLFLILLLSILGILGSRKATLDRNKKEILGILNSEDNEVNIVFKYGSISFKHRNITIVNRGNKDDIEFALMDGVFAIDSNGNEIDSSNITYDLDVNNIENRSYNVIYSVNDNGKEIIEERTITFVDDISYDFDYTGYSQTFVTDYSGAYKIQLWGAQGGNDGGKGAYTEGIIDMKKDNTLHVYVGGKGVATTVSTVLVPGGYNGGGASRGQRNFENIRFFATGGGATDIRFVSNSTGNTDSLNSRIMVAAGGGGRFSDGTFNATLGHGGTLKGIDSIISTYTTAGRCWGGDVFGGTQTSGGYGLGGSCISNQTNDTHVSLGQFGLGGGVNSTSTGGGGGYYGGGGSTHIQSAAGGSSFISGYTGCVAVTSKADLTPRLDSNGNRCADGTTDILCSYHYSGYIFQNPIMKAGNESMPNPRGSGNITGNSGNGYAKISLIYYY